MTIAHQWNYAFGFPTMKVWLVSSLSGLLLCGCSFISDEQLAYRMGQSICTDVWYLDEDGDGFGTGEAVIDCEPPAENYVDNADDCDDGNVAIHPLAIEDCGTEQDEDCDGSQNGTEMIGCQDWYVDADGDGFGQNDNIQCVCIPEDGFVDVVGDCDDSNASVSPVAIEICNDGLDNNCDGSANGCGYDNDFAILDGFGMILGSASRDYAGNSMAAGPILPSHKMGLVISASGVDSVIDDVGAVYVAAMTPGATTVDDALVHIYNSTLSNFGNILSADSDLNQDGWADLVISADSLPKNNQSGVGGLYVFYGPINQDRDVGSADVILVGNASNDRFAMDFAVVESMSQLWVGAPHVDTLGANAGAVSIFSNPTTNSAPSFQILGTNVGQRFGHSLSRAKDANGDGIADVVIGAYGENGNRGAAYLFDPSSFNSDTLELQSSDARTIWEGLQPEEQAGSKVEMVGDLDGDGYEDIWVGAANISTAYIVSGNDVGEHLLSDAPIQIVGASNSAIGFSVDRMGDINGDSYDDLVFGGYGLSQLHIIYGPLNGRYQVESDVITLMETGVDQVGYSISGVGDINADGIGDIAVGARISSLNGYKSGAVFLLEGLGL